MPPRLTRLLPALLALAALPAAAQPGPPQPLPEALASVRQPLALTAAGPARLSGPGADTLRAALAQARTVVLGEQHGTREVPAVMAALCQAMAPDLRLLALESGPTAIEQLEPLLRAPDRAARMARWTARHPAGVAFLDLDADSDAAADCLRSAPAARPSGIDQEFVGAGLLLLDALAERLPGDAAVETLRRREAAADARARRSGNPRGLLLLSATPADLAPLEAAAAASGDARVRHLFDRLAESAAIYRLSRTDGPASNARRALLLKRSLRAARPDGGGRALVRVGAWHGYKGVNPLNQRDLGNWIAEDADGRGETSLHILVTGASGATSVFGGYARPVRTERVDARNDRNLAWLAPALPAPGTTGWQLHDLRPLRHRRLAGLTPEWRRLLDGYDLLLVIPTVTPSRGVVPDATP